MNETDIYSPFLKEFGKDFIIEIINKNALPKRFKKIPIFPSSSEEEYYTFSYQVLEDEFIELDKHIYVRKIIKLDICSIESISKKQKKLIDNQIKKAEKLLKKYHFNGNRCSG